MRIHSRKSAKRLTRKERVRRPLRLALASAASVAAAGGLAALFHPVAGVISAVAAATAWIVAFAAREFGVLRVAAAEADALLTLHPLREGDVYPANPATLSPENALTLCQEILYGQPRRILELGSGSSTLLMARCLERLGAEGRGIISLDHVEDWAADSRRKIERAGLSGLASIHYAPLVPVEGMPAPWYDLEALPADAGPFDLVLVDGPEGGKRDPLARYGAFPLLRDRLAPNAVLLLDDALRQGEQEIVRRWLALEPRLEATFVPSHEGLTVLRLTG